MDPSSPGLRLALETGVALLAVAATTALSRVAGPALAAPDVVLLYLFAISAVAYRSGRGPALVAAAASVGAYNFFFVPPFHTFAVAEVRNVLTFVVMFGVGLGISTFTERTRSAHADAVERERRTAALYGLARDLAAAADEAGVDGAVARHGARIVEASREASDRADVRRVPLLNVDGDPMVAEIAATVDAAEAEAFAHLAGLALSRVRLGARADQEALRARAEEVRSALLSTVSHDLRTPLSAITGAATALVEAADRLPPAQRLELAGGIRDEADRMERLVTNLLGMTRVAAGRLEPRREWVPLEEIVGTALRRVSPAAHPVAIDLAPDLPLLPVDPILLEQVLVNLLDNAVRHTPPATPITVRGRAGASAVTIEVADAGPGLPPGGAWFEPFVRGPDARAGSGLGLAICRGIVEAHGGTIVAERAAEGGAAFRIELPVAGQPGAVPAGTDP